jgi:hypothetical protein
MWLIIKYFIKLIPSSKFFPSQEENILSMNFPTLMGYPRSNQQNQGKRMQDKQGEGHWGNEEPEVGSLLCGTAAMHSEVCGNNLCVVRISFNHKCSEHQE